MEAIKRFLEVSSGDGSGSGSGYGSGYGYGDGSGYGDGILIFNKQIVYKIDGVATIIKRVVNNLAKGFILNDDLTLTSCYVAKGHNLFAHGETAKKAAEALQEKIYANMDTDEAIELFLKTFELGKKYPAKDFYVWHNRLTGSCEMGRNKFVTEHDIDLDNGMYTVNEFIELTRNDYGGDIINRLAERIDNG